VSDLRLIRYAESLAIATLPADAPAPDWAVGHTFMALIRTARELVVVCRAAGVPGDVDAHAPYVGFEVDGSTVPSEPGLLTRLSERPGAEGISLIPFTTFGRGWLLVQRADADRVQTLWEQAGFTVTTAKDRL
jgi:hypothetical protein